MSLPLDLNLSSVRACVLLCLRKLKGALQGYDSVEDQFLRCGILVIHAEESVSHELETVKGFRTLEARLQVSMLYDSQGIRIQVQAAVLVVDTLLLIDNVLIQTNLCVDSAGSRYPMDGSLDLTACEAAACLSLRIISTMYALYTDGYYQSGYYLQT